MRLSEKNITQQPASQMPGDDILYKKEQEIKLLQKELKEARMQFTLEMEKQISEIRSTALFSMESPAPQLRVSLSGEVLWQNPASYILEFFEYEGKHFEADDFWKYITANFPVQSAWVLEVKSGDGYFSFYCRLFKQESYINIYGTDITDKIHAEILLENQKEFYEDILNQLPADIAVFDAQRHYLFLNPAAEQDDAVRKWMIGKTDSECYDALHDSRPAEESKKNLLNKVTQTLQPEELEEQLQLPGGKEKYFLRKMFPVPDKSGNIKMMIGYGLDITERIKIEQQIQVSEKRFRDLFNFSQTLICTHDILGNLVTVNPSICHLLGYTDSELKGRHLTDFMPAKSRALFFTDYLETIKAHGTAEGIFTIFTRARKKRYLLFHNYLVKEPGIEPYIIGSSQDITERKNIEDDLVRSEQKYRGIIENMNLGLVEVDAKGDIVYVNEVFCNMSGYSLIELTGKHPGELLLNESNVELFKNKVNGRAEGISGAYELVARNKKGESKWWFVSGAPLYDRANIFMGSVAVVLDITEQKLTEQQLQEAKKIAELSVKAKDDFLANMSHEIRTPLNAVTGMIRQMQKTTLTVQQRLYADAVSNASANLLVIINDILDFSKIEAGKLTIEHINFNFKEVINGAIEMVAGRAQEKGISVHSFIDDDLYEVMIGDPYRINQVLINLLSNAIKFTEKGSVTVSCTVQRQDETKQFVHIAVTDTGIGMNEEYLERLFDKFSQEDDSIARRYGGTGLGMSIIKQLVELMQGTVEVQSKKNAGTKIIATIPFEKSEAPVEGKKQLLNTDIGLLKDKRILLAEDNEMNRLVAVSILQQYGVQVDTAENGLRAVSMLQTKEYDIVLMDMRMPVMDGIEAVTVIRNEINTSIPVIALTANVINRDKEKCLEAGMNDFLSKPFEEHELINIILKWLNSKVYIAEKKEMNSNPATYESFSTARLKELGRGSIEFEKKMLNVFIKEASNAIEEFKKARETNDVKEIISIAHRIKASVMNMEITGIEKEIIEINASPQVQQDKEVLQHYVEKIIVTLGRVIEEIKEHRLI